MSTRFLHGHQYLNNGVKYSDEIWQKHVPPSNQLVCQRASDSDASALNSAYFSKRKSGGAKLLDATVIENDTLRCKNIKHP